MQRDCVVRMSIVLELEIVLWRLQLRTEVRVSSRWDSVGASRDWRCRGLPGCLEKEMNKTREERDMVAVVSFDEDVTWKTERAGHLYWFSRNWDCVSRCRWDRIGQSRVLIFATGD